MQNASQLMLHSAVALNWRQPLLHLAPNWRTSSDDSGALLELFQSNPTGILLLDASGCIIRINQAAQTILDFGDAIQQRDQRLHALRAADEARLQGQLSAALHAETGTAPLCMMLGRRHGQRDYLLHVIRLANSENDSAEAPVACVLICDPEAEKDAPPQLLERLFGLTPAEARVTSRVARGDALEDVATHLNLTRNAVKYHLKNIYRKTQTSRQAQLTRLVAELAWSSAFLAAAPAQNN